MSDSTRTHQISADTETVPETVIVELISTYVNIAGFYKVTFGELSAVSGMPHPVIKQRITLGGDREVWIRLRNQIEAMLSSIDNNVVNINDPTLS